MNFNPNQIKLTHLKLIKSFERSEHLPLLKEIKSSYSYNEMNLKLKLVKKYNEKYDNHSYRVYTYNNDIEVLIGYLKKTFFDLKTDERIILNKFQIAAIESKMKRNEYWIGFQDNHENFSCFHLYDKQYINVCRHKKKDKTFQKHNKANIPSYKKKLLF